MTEQDKIEIAAMIDRRLATILGLIVTNMLKYDSTVAKILADVTAELATGNIEWEQ